MSSSENNGEQPGSNGQGNGANHATEGQAEHAEVPDAVVPDGASELELDATGAGGPAHGFERTAGRDPDSDDPYDDPDRDDSGDYYSDDSGEWNDDAFLGGEAAVPPGDYGPPIASNLPDRELMTTELRELERRVRARLTPMFPMEQRRRLPLPFLWKRYRHLAMRDRSDYVDEFGRDPLYSSRIEPLLGFLYNQYFRVAATGVDNVPDSGPVLLVANHSGTLPYDGAIVMQAVRSEHPSARDVRPLVEDFVFHFPYLGTFINRIGGVRACQENATRLLENDQVVAVFPEGVKGLGKLYKDRYKLQRFGRGGFVKLALRTGAPIVPVSIVGAEEIHPMVAKFSWLAKSFGVPYLPITPTFPLLGPLGLLPLPSKWYLRFDAPIDLAATYGPEAAEDRILVNRLAESVRSRIQTMIDETLSERRSVLRG